MDVIEHKIPVSVEEEVKRSYLDYAMSVIVGRALPDVRDGLKPVHRRVLYSMSQLANAWNQPYKKSARIVGDVIGKYHPHGDQAVYDTLVRMAQDFSMRHPLVDGQGNFGSLDGDPPAAMRYCVTGDARVATPSGTLRIDAVVPGARPESDNDLDLEVLDRLGRTVRATKLFHSGDHPTLRVRTAEGHELTGTHNHPVLCIVSLAGVPLLLWKLLVELEPGDHVVMSRAALVADEAMPERSRALSRDYVPHVAEYIRSECGSRWTDRDWLVRHNVDRVERWEGGGTAILERIESEEVKEVIAPLVSGDYFYAQVESVTDAGIQPVFSLRVESDDHSFLTNGFVSHNTEARMTKLAGELLADIDKETVDFQPNYDDSLEEPGVMPAKYPNLLVNGATGIAVGMATNIPPHNLGEIVDATVTLINDPAVKVEKLMKHVRGPDFPTAGIIYGAASIGDAYRTGRGVIRIRARADIERSERGRARDRIVITEVPYQVNKAKLIEQIAELVKDKKLDGVADIRDESNREGVRVVIEVKLGEEPDIILNNLYQQTQMTSSFGIILLAIQKDGTPKVLNLKEMLEAFVEHRREVITRRTLYELKKAEARAHILEGLKIALDHLDAIIKLIRAAATPDVARAAMVKQFAMTETQAQAVLDMRLQRLTGLERQKILDELKATLELIEELEDILASERRVLDIIVEELKAVKAEYADPRRTEIVHDARDFTVEDLIAEEDMVVTCSHAGYIKRTPLSLYRQQRRGGKGRIGAVNKEGDFVEHLFVASTHAYIMVFTAFGMAYWLKVYSVPQAGPASRGKAIINLLPRLEKGDSVAAILPVEEFVDDKFIIFATEQGIVKKTELSAFSHPKVTGIIAIKVLEGDALLSARLTDGAMDIILGTYQGKAIRFPEAEVRSMGRNTTGVKGIALSEGDVVIGVDTVREDLGTILTVTENGYGKRTEVGQYKRQHRGGMGLIDIKTSARNGPVVGQSIVTSEDEVMIITHDGKVIRIPTAGVKVQGRNTQGVTIIDLGDDDRVVALARLAEAD